MRRISICLIFCILILGCSTTFKNLTVITPDLTQIGDGVFRGMYDLKGTPVKVTLDVVIQNNRIVSIEIIQHISSPIGKRAENIIDKIIEFQNLDVDVVSGATASSKSILKAVENALQ